MNSILLLINSIVGISIFAVVAAVGVDFLFFQERNDQKKEKKSPVATFTMFLFFFLFYTIERNGWGVLQIPAGKERNGMIICGLLFMLLGAGLNIFGRFNLGKNWSDHIKIYQSHQLVTSGAYSWVRHPLYASLIWMFYGSAMIYANLPAFLLNTFIFLPAMYFRAKQEEKMLAREFSGYEEYKKKVGMFWPRFFTG